MNVSTVHRILYVYHCPLRFTDPASGTRIRQERARRYEYAWPGEMIHVDVKKLGRVPDGGGLGSLGRVTGDANKGPGRNRELLRGYTFNHHAGDDPVTSTPRYCLTRPKKLQQPLAEWAYVRALGLKNRTPSLLPRLHRALESGQASHCTQRRVCLWPSAQSIRPLSAVSPSHVSRSLGDDKPASEARFCALSPAAKRSTNASLKSNEYAGFVGLVINAPRPWIVHRR